MAWSSANDISKIRKKHENDPTSVVDKTADMYENAFTADQE